MSSRLFLIALAMAGCTSGTIKIDPSDSDTDPTGACGTPEVCDGVDNDCDGLVDREDPGLDESTLITGWADGDADGVGSGQAQLLCALPAGLVATGGDCDDDDDDVFPEAPELCDGKDNDCDDLVDDDDLTEPASTPTWYADHDGDGWGDDDDALVACLRDESVQIPGDCDDTAAAVNPDQPEICNAYVDDDCDGLIDDDDPDVDPATLHTWALDDDGDGYGDADEANPPLLCHGPPRRAPNVEDCDDTRTDVNPDGAEVCDPDDADEDCSGLADDDDPGVDPTTRTAWYPDADQDGWAVPGTPRLACDPTATEAHPLQDCDDSDAAVFPGALERCDGQRNDCDDPDWTTDAGLATLVPFTPTGLGDPVDRTADMLSGGSVYFEGQMSLCEGTWTAEMGMGDGSTLVGVGAPGSVILDGENTFRTVRLYGTDTLIRNLHITRGAAPLNSQSGGGGGVYAADNPLHMEDVEVSHCIAFAYGGAIHARYEEVTLTRVVVRDSQTIQTYGRGGGLYLYDTDATLTDVTFLRNTCDTGGGLFRSGNNGALTIDGALFEDNHARIGGGASTDGLNEASFVDVEMRNNTADDRGGGLYVWYTDLQLTDCVFSDNTAEVRGGGAAAASAALTLTGTTFTSNHAGNGVSGYGGGLHATETDVVLQGVQFDANTTRTGSGAGLYQEEGDLTCLSDPRDGTLSRFEHHPQLAVRATMTGVYDDVTIDGAGCHFADNGPYDLQAGSATYDLVAGSSVSCNRFGCTVTPP
jgi:hypothetical protein